MNLNNVNARGAVHFVREHIEKRDRLIELFGMKIEKVEPGKADVIMTVTENQLNAASLCHGGAIFSLADVAFALACNSHGIMALALEVSINYLRPAKKGETLKAMAREKNLGKRTGLYIVEVVNEKGKKVAFCKATAYRLDGKFPEGDK